MPQVPYQPFATEHPGGPGPGGVRVDTPQAAFGGAVGHALEGLGKGIEHAGSELYQRAAALQQLQNETDATNAKTEFMTQAGLLREQFGTMEGRKAAEALPKLQKDLAGARDGIRSSLKNDAARKMYDGESLGVMGRVIFSAAGHAGQQTKQANDQAIDASINSKMTDIYNNGYYPGWENEIKTLMAQKSSIKGWDPETEEKNLRAITSTAKSHYLTGLAQREPMRAMEEYGKVKGTLNPDDDLRVQHSLTAAGRTSVSRVLAQKEMAKTTDEPAEVRAARVGEEAEKALPQDSQIGWYAQNAFYTLLNRHNAQIAAAQRQNSRIVDKALAEHQPKSPDELMAVSPEAKQAWQSLGAKEQKSYLSVMRTIAAGDHFETEETRARVQVLKDMAQFDPAKFLNVSIPQEMDGRLPNRDQKELLAIQRKTKVNVERDPRVNQALTLLGEDMLREHVFKKQSEEKFFQFRGALHEAIQTFQEVEKRPPKPPEMLQIGRQLLQRVTKPRETFMGFKVSEQGELFGFKSTQDTGRLFEAGSQVPTREIEAIMDEEEKRGRRRPSRVEVQNAIFARQYRDLYGKPPEVAGGK